MKGFAPEKGAKISLIGKKGSAVKWKKDGNGFKLLIPESISKSLPSNYAIAFKISHIVK